MSARAFSVGDTVLVVSLKKVGQVSELLRSGVYRVSIGSLSMVVAESDLRPHSAPQREGKKIISFPDSRKGPKVSPTIDLHGLTVEDAVRKLESWLNDSILAGHGSLKVIHGLGSGRVQRATHETLQRYSAVRAFRINDLNPGETDVHLG
jgi:DNA mismatch repair protein MutS2